MVPSQFKTKFPKFRNAILFWPFHYFKTLKKNLYTLHAIPPPTSTTKHDKSNFFFLSFPWTFNFYEALIILTLGYFILEASHVVIVRIM